MTRGTCDVRFTEAIGCPLGTIKGSWSDHYRYAPRPQPLARWAPFGMWVFSGEKSLHPSILRLYYRLSPSFQNVTMGDYDPVEVPPLHPIQ